MSELVGRNPELYPPSCKTCLPNDQRTYWRSFTNLAYPSFGQDSTLQPAIDHAQVEEGGKLIVDSSIVDKPGVLWSSTDPSFSLAVGMARGVMKDRTIHLVGFNYCKHDTEDGVRSYGAFQIGRATYRLVPVGSDRDFSDYPFTDGTIFSHLSERQIAGIKHYSIHPQFLVDVRKKLSELFKKFQKKTSIHTVSQELSSALNIYLGNNPDHFLEFLLKDGVLVTEETDVTSSTSTNLIGVLIENLTQELHKDARRETFLAFGGEPQLAELKSEYLGLLGKVANCSPDQKEEYVRELNELYARIHEWDDMN